MNKQIEIEYRAGQIKFAGVPRCWDDLGRNAFEISLPERPTLYGEWNESFDANEIEFKVEIVSFGYLDGRNLANPYPDARLRLSCHEIFKIKDLIFTLFSSRDATKSVASFSSQKATYTGEILFLPGWVREQ